MPRYLTFTARYENGVDVVTKTIINAKDDDDWHKQVKPEWSNTISISGYSEELNPRKFARLDAMDPADAFRELDQDCNCT